MSQIQAETNTYSVSSDIIVASAIGIPSTIITLLNLLIGYFTLQRMTKQTIREHLSSYSQLRLIWVQCKQRRKRISDARKLHSFIDMNIRISSSQLIIHTLVMAAFFLVKRRRVLVGKRIGKVLIVEGLQCGLWINTAIAMAFLQSVQIFNCR